MIYCHTVVSARKKNRVREREREQWEGSLHDRTARGLAGKEIPKWMPEQSEGAKHAYVWGKFSRKTEQEMQRP